MRRRIKQLCWGLAGLLSTLGASLFISNVWGSNWIAFMQDFNVMLLLQIHWPMQGWEPGMMMLLQIAGVGFACGLAAYWMSARK